MKMNVAGINEVSISNGRKAEIQFPTLCWEQGWECASPQLDEMPYDFVARTGTKKFKAVQVKQVYRRKGRNIRYIALTKTGQNSTKRAKYAEGDFDTLAIFDPESNEWWMVPWSKVNKIYQSHSGHEINIDNLKLRRYKVK
jgi:hypothetical protein